MTSADSRFTTGALPPTGRSRDRADLRGAGGGRVPDSRNRRGRTRHEPRGVDLQREFVAQPGPRCGRCARAGRLPGPGHGVQHPRDPINVNWADAWLHGHTAVAGPALAVVGMRLPPRGAPPSADVGDCRGSSSPAERCAPMSIAEAFPQGRAVPPEPRDSTIMVISSTTSHLSSFG